MLWKTADTTQLCDRWRKGRLKTGGSVLDELESVFRRPFLRLRRISQTRLRLVKEVV